MIEVESLFKQVHVGIDQAKMKVENCPVGVYYGCSEYGNLQLAFLTDNPPIVIESTANLKVSQWAEGANVYWTCFELLNDSAKSVFFVLCDNLIKAAVGTHAEEIAMTAIKNRFTIWKKLFKNPTTEMTAELYKGLFGELYFLYKWMFVKYEPCVAVNSWSGADRTAKDFSISNDWYEIKTISTNAETVKISSITQLDSDFVGRLVLVNTEQMSDEFNNDECTVEQLITLILTKLNDESVKESFIEKIVRYGYDVSGSINRFHKYKVSSIEFYKVEEGFPRITAQNVPYSEIARVTYELSISSINRFLEDKV